ncbi:MAG: hypothetical protein GXP27_19510 [Planctomycetes bacterium]|nr:hypothetical protein [Planctomycetota bacterium]
MKSQEPSRSVQTRKLIAIGLAVAIVAGVAVLVRRNPPASSPLSDEDQMDDCITQMLQAAQQGDVQRYLDCFAGDLRAKLAARLEKGNPEAAAAELRSGQAELKSYVTTDWRRVSEDEATLILERVYKDYNERHRVRLRRKRGAWKIVELTPLESFAPEIPYGTPVFELPEAKQKSTNKKTTSEAARAMSPNSDSPQAADRQ